MAVGGNSGVVLLQNAKVRSIAELEIALSMTANEHQALEAPAEDQRTGVFVRLLMEIVRLY